MKKIYSIVLMAAALLIGTNVNAVEVSSAAQLKEKIEAATGDLTLELTKDLTGDDAVPNAGALGAEYKLNGNPTGLYAAGTASKTPWITIQNGQNVVLDLQGHAIESGNCLQYMFKILHGHITIKSTGSRGRIQSNHKQGSAVKIRKVSTPITSNPDSTIAYSPSSGYPFHIIGKVTSDISDWYSWLTIEDNVDIIGHASGATIYDTNGKSFGAYIEVKKGATVSGGKYGLQISGTVKKPADSELDFAYLPKIYVEEDAEVKNNDGTAVYASGVYAGGYGNTVIDGKVHGATGVYAKSGNVEITTHAQIASDATEYVSPNGRSAGNAASGSAIVMESNKAYSGNMNVSVSGNAHITGGPGYAVEAEVTTANANQVKGIELAGGTFTTGAGGQGCMDVAPVIADGASKINIDGADFDNQSEIAAVLTAIGQESFLSQTTDPDGNIIYVVTANNTGEKLSDNQNVAIDGDKKAVVWTGNNSGNAVTADLTYLELRDKSHLTIPDNVVLHVGTIVMTANAKITIKSGAKLVISGTNGLLANEISNIIVEAEEGSMGQLLISPATSIHDNPAATVQFVSKSYRVSATDRRNQRFGIPTIGALESIDAVYNNSPAPTKFWGYVNGTWTELGTINDGSVFDVNKMNKPFAYYQMLNNVPAKGSIVTMTGNLVGNASPALEVKAGEEWVTFANSYMANMSMQKMLAMFDGHDNMAGTVQSYTPTSANTFAWVPFNMVNILFGEDKDVEPMQAFIVQNLTKEADQLDLDYSEMVWKPSEGASAKAARTPSVIDATTARIYLTNANGIQDYVSMVADAQFSTAYDNGYDAEKVMNNTLDLYTVGVKNMSTLATDNLDNTILGFACAEAGEYTISFSNINGDNLTLVDRKTGARIAMAEGNTYSFNAEANSSDNGRFMIVGINNAPTAVENVETTFTKGAVYTAMGQYVGTVENWNNLPAGVYVVDGVKYVK